MIKKSSIIKFISYILVLIVMSSTLCGCGIIPEVDLTDEQSELVSEYAAGLIMKYSKGHKNGLVRVSSLDFKELNVTPTPTPMPAPEVSDELVTEALVADDDALIETEGESESGSVDITIIPMNEAFSLYGAELVPSSIELVSTYPQSDESLVFSMNASLGNVLLVMHFDINNISGGEASFESNLNGYKVRAVVNGGDKIRSEITFLENDLLNYSGTLAPNQTEDVVLVFEVPEGTEVNSLDLLLVQGKDELRYKLY